MKKSKEIITTAGELLEHYIPWLIGLIMFALSCAAFYGAMKELEGLELDGAEGGLILLLGMSLIYWVLGRWAGENIAKLKKDEDAADNETTQDN